MISHEPLGRYCWNVARMTTTVVPTVPINLILRRLLFWEKVSSEIGVSGTLKPTWRNNFRRTPRQILLRLGMNHAEGSTYSSYKSHPDMSLGLRKTLMWILSRGYPIANLSERFLTNALADSLRTWRKRSPQNLINRGAARGPFSCPARPVKYLNLTVRPCPARHKNLL